MRTLAFFDCPTGIAGDMCLGALVSAGVPLAYLQTQLAQLNLPEPLKLKAHTVHRNSIAATQVEVVLAPAHGETAVVPPVRHLKDIEQVIAAAELPPRVSVWSLAIFRRLAIAEGSIHGIEPEAVHFHEVGATDAIADIVGTCLGLDWLQVDELYCAPLPTGRGTVRAAHGRLPVPAPAVLKLMEMAQVPIYNAGLQGELVTPTGAAIATELAHNFGDPPAMRLQRVGLGAGVKEFSIPNILRLWIGHSDIPPAVPHPPHTHIPTDTNPLSSEQSPPSEPVHSSPPPLPAGRATNRENVEQRHGLEAIVVLETQVDDLSPQAIGYLYDRLLKTGALDVFTQTVVMKKSRPGHLITVIAYPEAAQDCEQILLRETTTLGVRQHRQQRMRLRREIVPIKTTLGTVHMKVTFAPKSNRPLKAHPEYEDCAALARTHDLPWKEIHDQALCAWREQN